MFKIAIIQFPGLNTEYETRREIKRAGMKGEFFRWNESPSKLAGYDGYVIGGGFSYEDRGRAGVIASLDPIMDELKVQTAKGKPLLGICNGAQIVLESGLIPGVDGNKLVMALARNKRIQNGQILGTGYYDTWVSLKCTTTKEKSIFAWNFKEGEIIEAPIAHGEGRFTTEIAGLMEDLKDRGQMVFRYCDKQGVMSAEFPVNPNGAQFNVAALANPAGNVMAIMPHLERSSDASYKLFTSLRDGLEAAKKDSKKRISHLTAKPLPVWPLQTYASDKNTFQLLISLIINDNEAETHEMTLQNLGFSKFKLTRHTHVDISHSKIDLQKTVKKLIQSGVFLNTNKEWATVQGPKTKEVFDAKKEKFFPAPVVNEEGMISFNLLVREKPDFVGMSKLDTIQKRLKMPEITGVKVGTLWTISFETKSKKVAEDNLKKMIETNIFFNPHRQEAYLI